MFNKDGKWQNVILDFQVALDSVRSPDEVFEETTRTIKRLGYDIFAYARISEIGETAEPNIEPDIAFMNYPKDWVEQYEAEHFAEIDPVVQKNRQIGRPFRWGELSKTINKKSQGAKVFNSARDSGLHDGFTVPLLYPKGQHGLVSFASEHIAEKSSKAYTALPLIASIMHQTFLKFSESKAGEAKIPSLTEREKDCLRWIAQGKSSWDIGQILSIGECTVNYHVQKVMRKFSTSNRIVAVTIALRHGMI